VEIRGQHLKTPRKKIKDPLRTQPKTNLFWIYLPSKVILLVKISVLKNKIQKMKKRKKKKGTISWESP
jgi:hypothetical protein